MESHHTKPVCMVIFTVTSSDFTYRNRAHLYTAREKVEFVRYARARHACAHARRCIKYKVGTRAPRARMHAAAARAAPRGHAAAAASRQQESRQGDGIGRDAREALLMKHCLRSLKAFDHQVVPSLELVWLSSPSLRLGSRVALGTRPNLF